NGLDPPGTREVRSLLVEAAAAGPTVLASTPLLSGVEQAGTHVGGMRRGGLVAEDAMAQLPARTTRRGAGRSPDPAAAAAVLTGRGLPAVQVDGRVVSADLGSAAPPELVAALVHAGVPVLGFEVVEAGLDDLFVQLTGEGFDVSG